jgi:hypothetical protein
MIHAHHDHAVIDKPDIRQRLLGSWRLVSWQEHDASGAVSYPLGPDAVGQLSYDESGRVSAQLMRRNQPRFANEDWQRAAPAEKSAGWSCYFGYFGRYRFDERSRTVIHHIEGSWFPNLVGTDQKRQ